MPTKRSTTFAAFRPERRGEKKRKEGREKEGDGRGKDGETAKNDNDERREDAESEMHKREDALWKRNWPEVIAGASLRTSSSSSTAASFSSSSSSSSSPKPSRVPGPPVRVNDADSVGFRLHQRTKSAVRMSRRRQDAANALSWTRRG